MKIINFEELKTRTAEAPFYGVLANKSQANGDERAIGCCPLALLNLTLLLKRQMGIDDGRTAYQVLFEEVLRGVKEETDLSVSLQSALEYLDRAPVLNDWKAFVMNPSAMYPKIFWEILLKRLLQDGVALLLLEAPGDEGEEIKKSVNHMAVLHHDNGDILLDGVKMSVEALSNVLWYSPVNTVMLFSKKV